MPYFGSCLVNCSLKIERRYSSCSLRTLYVWTKLEVVAVVPTLTACAAWRTYNELPDATRTKQSSAACRRLHNNRLLHDAQCYRIKFSRINITTDNTSADFHKIPWLVLTKNIDLFTKKTRKPSYRKGKRATAMHVIRPLAKKSAADQPYAISCWWFIVSVAVLLSFRVYSLKIAILSTILIVDP